MLDIFEEAKLSSVRETQEWTVSFEVLYKIWWKDFRVPSPAICFPSFIYLFFRFISRWNISQLGL